MLKDCVGIDLGGGNEIRAASGIGRIVLPILLTRERATLPNDAMEIFVYTPRIILRTKTPRRFRA